VTTKQAVMTEDDEVLDQPTETEELVITEAPPKSHDDDDDDIDPEQPDKVPANDETEAIRERRRKEKVERKERRDKAILRDKLELDFLSKRNAELERRFSSLEQRQHQNDLGVVDQRIRDAVNEVAMAEKVIAKAVEAGNGNDVAQAMRYRDQAIAKAQELNGIKQQATQRPVQQPEQRMDPTTLGYAQAFVKENSWYDPQGRDEDSAVVLAIDQAIVRDGFKPDSAEYWAELRKRAARRLPERFTETKERTARGGPAMSSSREYAPTSTRQEVYISPERKQALIEAGVWDNPTLRMKYVKRYSEYDRNNRA